MTTKTAGRNTTIKINLEVSKSKPNEKMVSRQQCIGGVTGRRGPGSYISLFSSYISFLHFNAFSPPTFHFYISMHFLIHYTVYISPGNLEKFSTSFLLQSYYFLLHFTIFLSPTFNNFVLPPTSCNIIHSTFVFHFTTCGAYSYISSHGHVKHYADNQENIEFLKG